MMATARITSGAVCSALGITYRQLDYWARLEGRTPGSGAHRVFTREAVYRIAIALELAKMGEGRVAGPGRDLASTAKFDVPLVVQRPYSTLTVDVPAICAMVDARLAEAVR